MISEKQFFDDFYNLKPKDVYEDTTALKKISRIVTQQIIDSIQLKKNDSILSLGCGNGRFELRLAPQVKRIVGIDISKTAIANAQSSAAKLKIKNADFYVKDVSKHLPFKDGTFDKVLAIAVLHHLIKIQPALKEIYRLLKHHGIFYSIDPNARGILRKIGRTFFKKIYFSHHSPEEGDLDYRQLIKLSEKTGFKIEKLDFPDFLTWASAHLWPNLPLRLFDLLIFFDKIWCTAPLLKNLSSSFALIGRKT